MTAERTYAPLRALSGSTGRKDDRRTEAIELRLELRVRSDEERAYVSRTRDGFHRIIRCLHGGLVDEAYALASTGLAVSNRRLRQLDPDGGTVA